MAYAVSPHRGSEVGNSWRLANELAKAGHDVELLTSERFAEDWIGQSLPPGLHITIVPRDIPGGKLSRNAAGWYARYWVFLRRCLKVAREKHAATPFDVAHHFSWGSLAWGTPVWRLSIPTVFGPAGGGSFVAPAMRPLFTRAQLTRERAREIASRLVRFNPLARQTVRHCTVLATNSDTERLIQKLGGRAQVVSDASVPPAVLEMDPLPMESRCAGQLVWVGRLIPIKAVDVALRAMRSLDEFHLVVVGDGEARQSAEALALSLGVKDRVTFTGALSWTETIDVIRRSFALLFTSTRDTFGAQLLEAGGAGTPIVAIDQHGTADHVPRAAGILVPVGSPDEVALAMADGISALSMPDAWNSASSSSRRFGESLSVERHLSAIVEAYRVAGKSPMPQGRRM